jgi:alpha-1,6-mannosyltransferase
LIDAWMSRPAVLRYLGLCGSICCAVAGLLGGATRQLPTRVTLGAVLGGPHGVPILALWTAGLAALCLAWWYGRRLPGLPTRWILGTAALWCLPMLFTLPLASRDVYSYACQGALYDWGGNPYVQSVSSQPCPWLDSVSVLWRDTPTPYGPLFVLITGGAAAPGSQVLALVLFRALAVASLVLVAAVLPVLARRAGVPAGRALWLVLACPVVPVHLVGGGHNDATVIALVVAGMAVLADREARAGALIAGGVLLGLAAAVKPTLGVVLPFGALLAARGPATARPAGDRGPATARPAGDRGPATARPAGDGGPATASLVRRGGTVMAAALGTLVLGSFATGLGLGWVTALSGANKARNWSSAPTAVGITIEAVGRWFGQEWPAMPAARAVALLLLPVVLLAILWRTWAESPLYGAGLACLAVIFLAPITQPWYLMWPAVLFAATTVAARWFAGTIVFSMFTILPAGDPAFRYLIVPLSFAVTVLTGWVTYVGVRWLRGARPDRAAQPVP